MVASLSPAVANVEVRLLGPVQVSADGRPLPLGRAQMRAVLAILAVEAGRPVPTEALAARVWDEDPPRAWREVLYSHVARIRRVLAAATGGGPVRLVRQPAGYLLDIHTELIDLHRFRRLTAAGIAEHSDPARVALLRPALDLWQGVPLADVRGGWADRSRTAWYQHRLDAVVAWADAELRLGHGDRVTVVLRNLVGEYPMAEPLAGALMRALAQAGRVAEALEHYAALRARLAEELGAEPAPELQALHQAVLRDQLPRPASPPTAAPAIAPPRGAARTPFPRPAQLPAAAAGFVGRREALRDLDALLDTPGHPSTAIVSAVSGTAGVGKTTLAVHWARRVRERFPDGQLYADLRGFDGSGLIVPPSAVVRRFLLALGVTGERVPDDPEAAADLYRSLLSGRRVLILLDNARDAAQVRPLLPGGPAAFCLITSRNRLTPLVAVEGAHAIALDLLSTAEAHTLLESRLGADRVAAEPEATDRVIVHCARLPLALGITAARASQSGFPLDVLARDLADERRRLSALDAGDPSSDVAAVFSWSCRALSDPAARLFRLLGLHPGPDIDADAAACLAGTAASRATILLSELTAANLLTERSPGRFASHDLLRAYATDLCRETDPAAERDAATRRLLDHYLHTCLAADRLLDPARDAIPLPPGEPSPGTTVHRHGDDAQARAWLTAEHQVLLGVVQLAVDTGHDRRAWQLVWALDTFLHRRGFWPDRSRMWQVAVDAAGRLGDPVAAAHAYRDLGRADNRRGHYTHSDEHLHRALDLFGRAGDRAGQAHTHRALASLCERLGRPRQALRHDREALALFEAAGSLPGQADALNSIGWDHCLLGDYAQALRCCRRALDLHRRTGDVWGEATTWDSIGYAHHHLGNHPDAVECYARALELVRALGDRYFEADTMTRLADTHEAAGDSGAARDSLRTALDILTDLDHADAEEIRARLKALI
ncbi:AfsR/SARP family transcriptional regulator [Mangrovihabitans endophyticus]|uniref:AfsR/SARP family transcriptional regulator n=1 Tax=Mangrovihabitans endophyticus TaxID=1751298 RepID=UPI001E340D14|nr:AfsR/SARP family transcriptional regulator [Mangrovihabitans endophyticus]